MSFGYQVLGFGGSGTAAVSGNSEGIVGFGETAAGKVATTNLISDVGVVASDETGVGTARNRLGACEYGTDKGIFGFGRPNIPPSYMTNLTNLVSNAGVVATDTAGVGTARNKPGSCEYGTDKAIFAYGAPTTAISNLVSNTGVVASDVAGVGTARDDIAACSYGGDKGIFAYGYSGGNLNMSNLVSNTGVVGADVTGVGTARYGAAATQYGNDKGIFFGGEPLMNDTNLVSNTGVVATDVSTVASDKAHAAACSFN